MTVIVGLETPDGVLVGCDAFYGGQRMREVWDRPKWRDHGHVLIGTAGEVRPGQIAELIPAFRKRKRGEDVVGFLRDGVAEPVRAAIAAGGLGEGEPLEWGALVATAGELYAMDPRYGLMRSAAGYTAIGAGAIGAVHAFAVAKGPPLARVLAVLRACALHTTYVCPPFYTVLVARDGGPPRPVAIHLR